MDVKYTKLFTKTSYWIKINKYSKQKAPFLGFFDFPQLNGEYRKRTNIQQFNEYSAVN